jgi:hypothetical protein
MIRDWLSIPYRRGGRGRDGADCWGFVRIVVKDGTGKDLPSYECTSDVSDLDLHPFLQITVPEDWCVVLMHGTGGAPVHSGVWLDGNVLHMTTGGPGCVPWRRVARLATGLYRPL